MDFMSVFIWENLKVFLSFRIRCPYVGIVGVVYVHNCYHYHMFLDKMVDFILTYNYVTKYS